jgi:hypothetical protein
MLDQIRRDIQALLDELLGEIDRLRRALAALTSRESEPASADRVTPADARTASVGEGAAKSSRARSRRTTRTRSASSLAPASAQKPAGSAAAPARTRTAPGATKAAVLAALKDGSAMTAWPARSRPPRDSAARRSAPLSPSSRGPARSSRPRAATRFHRRPMLLLWMAPGRPAPRRIRLSGRGGHRSRDLAKQDLETPRRSPSGSSFKFV